MQPDVLEGVSKQIQLRSIDQAQAVLLGQQRKGFASRSAVLIAEIAPYAPGYEMKPSRYRDEILWLELVFARVRTCSAWTLVVRRRLCSGSTNLQLFAAF